VQGLIVKGKYQSSVICSLTALGFNIRVPTQIVIETLILIVDPTRFFPNDLKVTAII